MRQPGQKCKVGEKPPEDCVAHSPTHARAVSTDVSLKQEGETDADHDRDTKMQKDHGGPREGECSISREQRKVVARCDPRAEDRASDDSGKSARYDGAADAEFRLLRKGMKSAPNAEGQTNGRTQTEDVGDKMGKAIARIGEHCGGGVLKDKADGTVGKGDPGEEGET